MTGEELLLVGRIVAAQGLKGELRVNPLSDFPERFTRPGRRWLRQRNGPDREIQLLSGRQLPGRELYVVRLEGIHNRTDAEGLVGHELLVPASERPKLAKGEFHLMDLVGLEVRLLEASGTEPGISTVIGTVTDLLHAGNDLLEVQLNGSEQAPGRQLWIPFVKAIVPRVELSEGWIGITPPPGLLDLAIAPENS